MHVPRINKGMPINGINVKDSNSPRPPIMNPNDSNKPTTCTAFLVRGLPQFGHAVAFVETLC